MSRGEVGCRCRGGTGVLSTPLKYKHFRQPDSKSYAPNYGGDFVTVASTSPNSCDSLLPFALRAGASMGLTKPFVTSS
jgi:hypothetical protein